MLPAKHFDTPLPLRSLFNLQCLTCAFCSLLPPHLCLQMGGLSLATAQAAAAAAAALMPPPPPHSSAANGGTTTYTGGTFTAPTATATKWWTDPNLTFGPAVDTDMLTRRAAGARTASLANGREGLEVQSGGMSSKRSAQAAPEAQRRGSLYSEGRRHLKRKAAVAVDADEASSGTTGHALGSHDIDAGVVSYKVRGRTCVREAVGCGGPALRGGWLALVPLGASVVKWGAEAVIAGAAAMAGAIQSARLHAC
jgi:hypothetical protein